MRGRFFVGLLGLAFVAVISFYLTLPNPAQYETVNPHWTAVMEQRAAEAAAENREFIVYHRWVPLQRMSWNLRRAVIVGEDGRFREHNGIDWRAYGQECRYRGDGEFGWLDPSDLWSVARAGSYCVRHMDKLNGRSTITQQLAKNLYFSTKRSLVRKFREVFVARRLEKLGKDRILELYLNSAEWGPGIFGAEAAAQHYFKVSCSQLTKEQAVLLAATLPNPLARNPKRTSARVEYERARIREGM